MSFDNSNGKRFQNSSWYDKIRVYISHKRPSEGHEKNNSNEFSQETGFEWCLDVLFLATCRYISSPVLEGGGDFASIVVHLVVIPCVLKLWFTFYGRQEPLHSRRFSLLEILLY